MLKQTLDHILRPRHYWRNIGYDELSELYLAVLLRSLALSLVGIFVPVYMLKLGYGVGEVCFLFASYFTIRVFVDIIAGYTVARLGPKHTIVIATVFQIISLSLFVALAKSSIPLWLLGGMYGTSMSFYFVAFNVDFSKVKHKNHGGKELSYVNIMERIGATAGPLIGGLVATFFGAQYTFILAIIVLIAGLVPLFKSAEPVRTHQKLDFKGFKIDGRLRDYFSFAAQGVEHTLTLGFWPLYLGVYILLSNTGYAKLGILTSVSVLIAVLVIQKVGKAIDNHKGLKFLRAGSVAAAGLNLARPFITTYPVAMLSNIASEVTTVGYRLPYMKGLYDMASDLPGYRIVYLSSVEAFGTFIKGAVWWLLVILTTALPTHEVFVVGFVIAAVSSLLINIQNFPALKSTGHKRYNHN